VSRLLGSLSKIDIYMAGPSKMPQKICKKVCTQDYLFHTINLAASSSCLC